MIRVHLRDPSGRLSERTTTADPVEAEVSYLRLVSRRPGAPVVLIVDPGQERSVPSAHYRLDVGWSADVPREEGDERRLLQWEHGPPTQAMVRALGVVAGLTGAEAARLCGVSGDRTWRRWIGGEREMPAAAYWWLLVVTGFHPEWCRK